MRSAIFTAALAAALACSASQAGARPSWVPLGPPGGNVRALACDPREPRRLYLGTSDGVLYRSDDGGLSWQRPSPGFPKRGFSLDDLVVDPRGVVLVGYRQVHGDGGGVARSADGGTTFTILAGVEGESVRALAVAPGDPEIVAAGTLRGVHLSRDGGRSWTLITPEGHPDLRNFDSLAFDPEDPRVLVAGTWHLAWRTEDHGATWSPVHRGMIDDSDVMTLAFDRRDPRTLYATACTGIYRSSDAGREWRKLEGIPYSARRTRAFFQSPEEPELLLAGTTEGLWISRDGGATWRCATSREAVVNAVVVRPGGDILAGTEDAGVLRSGDGGWTWEPSNRGFSERFVSRILYDPNEKRLLAAVWGAPRDAAVFASSAAARDWTRLGEGLEGRQVLTLARIGATLLAGTDAGIFARGPRADAWRPLPVRVHGEEIRPRIHELLALPGGELLAATPEGVLLGARGGESWTQPRLWRGAGVTGLARSPADPDLVVAATRVGFFRSHDRGRSWTLVSRIGGVTPHALAFLAGDEPWLFATTTGGLFRSGDQGATWRRVEGGLPPSDLTGIAVHPDGRTLYVSDFARGGVFRSPDRGTTWERMPTDGLASDRVWTLCLDPSDPDRLLAAPAAGGIHLLEALPAITTTTMTR